MYHIKNYEFYANISSSFGLKYLMVAGTFIFNLKLIKLYNQLSFYKCAIIIILLPVFCLYLDTHFNNDIPFSIKVYIIYNIKLFCNIVCILFQWSHGAWSQLTFSLQLRKLEVVSFSINIYWHNIAKCVYYYTTIIKILLSFTHWWHIDESTRFYMKNHSKVRYVWLRAWLSA